MNRRRFPGGLAGGGMAAPAAETPPVRVAVVGVGQRGAGLPRTLLMLDGVEITAAADLTETRLAGARRLCQDAGRTAPAAYAKGPEDYRRLVERPDVDIVIAATPWEWHTPVMLAAMDAGKAAATEVPAGVTVEDCWALVEKPEKTGAHCTMLENWVFRREPLAVLNMARAGLLGEVFHCECGYNHDVRYTKFDTPDGNRGELRWRGVHAVKRNGSLYPTHSLAPPALLMDVNRGTRMEYLVSMSTPSRGMNEYAARRWGTTTRKAVVPATTPTATTEPAAWRGGLTRKREARGSSTGIGTGSSTRRTVSARSTSSWPSSIIRCGRSTARGRRRPATTAATGWSSTRWWKPCEEESRRWWPSPTRPPGAWWRRSPRRAPPDGPERWTSPTSRGASGRPRRRSS